MATTIPLCPHCGAPLATTRFAALAVCSYCDATVRIDPSLVSASRYREAWRAWNSAMAGDDSNVISISDSHWMVDGLLAHGEVSDVYFARRARWPTELAVLKVLRDPDDGSLLESELRALERLHRNPAVDGMNFAMRVPFSIVHGTAAGGNAGGLVGVYRWAQGFLHTFEAIRVAFPNGIAPPASIWIWRRILETLSVMGRAGLVHGAVLPNHLLIQEGEHGVRLVGFGCADLPGAHLRVVCSRFEHLYPTALLASGELAQWVDIVMSARCIAYLLGGSAHDGEVPAHVPAPLAEILRRCGSDTNSTVEDSWSLHQELGEIGRRLFGPPAFHPIVVG